MFNCQSQEITSFVVNRPPFILSKIENKIVVLSDTIWQFIADLNSVFRDPDGDTPTYFLTNSNSSVAIASIEGASLSILPGLTPGEATIEVIAIDGRGGITSTKFTVTVVTDNYPPELTENTIADTILIIGAQVYRKNLNLIFKDSDNDTLSFNATSSNISVAVTTVSNDTLVVVQQDTGSTTINVIANDNKGGEASTEFTVYVVISPQPEIVHNSIKIGDNNNEIPITAQIIDDECAISSAILNYRQANQPDFFTTVMDRSTVNDTTINATATIPAFVVTSKGVEYFINATDVYDVASRLPPDPDVFSVRVDIDGEGVRNSRPQSSGSEQTSYHLFSIPLDVENKSPQAILQDDLESYDIYKWRFFDIKTDLVTGEVTKVEFPHTAEMSPGKAFWLIVKESGKFIDTGPGKTILTSESFPIPLQKGWNLVGNPFNFTTVAEDTLSNGDPLSIYAYESGEWSDPYKPKFKELQPFEGYAVFCATACTLFVNPHPFSGRSLPKKESTAGVDALWSIRIRARCQQARDGNNIAAVIAGTKRDWDHMDYPEPPVIGEYVSVYFPHPEWD